MAKKSLKKNYIFNLTYQILLLLAPFITTPYLSRVLGVEGIGLYSYSNSIVTYFVLVATLGTTTFAQRKISYVSDNKEERSRAFWEMFIFRLVTSAVTLAVYLVVFTVIFKENWVMYLILSLNILNLVFDVSWFLQGLEEFGKTTIISILFKILNVVLIFVFVKTADDLNLYILITVSLLILSNLTIWLFLPKYICKVKNLKPFKDTKGILQLFIPTVAIQIYTVLDKSMIGWFSEGNAENGYYEQSEKIVRMALTVVVSLGTVMIPRISRKYAEGDYEAINSYLYKSYRFVWMMGLPIMFGLIAVSSVFIPVFLGDGYENCILLLQIFSVLVVFIGISNVTGMQYFVPTGKQNLLTLTVVIGAVANLCLNLVLIPFFKALGACISSIIAEFLVALSGLIIVKKKKYFPLKPIFKPLWKYLVSGLVMFGVLLLIKYFLPLATWALIVLIASGVLVYFVMLLILRDSFLLDAIKKVLSVFKSIFKKRHKKEAEVQGANEEDKTVE